MVFADFLPIATGNVVKLKRCVGGLCLRLQLLRALTFVALYALGFAAARLLRSAVKATT